MFAVVNPKSTPDLYYSYISDEKFGVQNSILCHSFSRQYNPIYFGHDRCDVSFAVDDGAGPQLLVFATHSVQQLDYYGAPIQLFGAAGCPDAALKLAFAELDRLAALHGLSQVKVADPVAGECLSPIGKACLDRRARPSLALTARADLTNGEAGLRQGLRKSFKSLINWGQSHQTIRAVTAQTPDRALFDRYQRFHQTIAGRVTRAQATWDLMFDAIRDGNGELLMGFLADDDLVAGTLVLDAKATAYYASGVYDRSRFDKPLGHWPLWLAMLHARERGKDCFDLGQVPLDGAADPKEIAIGYFKRGFATEIGQSLTWSWEVPPAVNSGV